MTYILNYTHFFMQKIILLFCFIITSVLSEAQNYSESKAGNHPLPPLFKTTFKSGAKALKYWETDRRKEILKLFEDNVYGEVPKYFDSIRFSTPVQNHKAIEGKAIYKKIAIEVFRNARFVTINLHEYIPKNTRKPVPVFLVINHRGNKADISVSDSVPFTPVNTIVDAGYAVAAFDVADVAPDNKETYRDQLLKKIYPEQLNKQNGMGALGAWGWAASRCIDWFANDPLIDAAKVVVVGHSRGGKAALWCAAQDERVAIAISNESGNSGAKISRRNFGETVQVITERFPHWFTPAYRNFANREQNLPVDQHMLLALLAPRGVYVAAASKDLWADPKGQYLALYASKPVFELYGFKPNLPPEIPPENNQVISGPVGFHLRPGEHDMIVQDWNYFIDYVNKFFKRK